MPINAKTELTELRRRILSMGAAVESRVDRVLDALIRQDYELARSVRHGDREIDQMEVDIEQACMRILALAPPVAGDLRFVLAVLRINSDLERTADLAKSIAKRILDMEEAPAFRVPDALIKMATYARGMLSDVLGALANQDVATCQRIRREDKRVDDLQKEVFGWAHREIPIHTECTQGAIDVLSITRAVERIGDQVTNIAEDVIFMVEGSIVRHKAV
jgi:phosphate transport system protein